jgi:CRP/FNR family transcriptional regulator, cyclic AMP receptor protein
VYWPQELLANARDTQKRTFKKNQMIFSQGDPANALYYLRVGVKLTVTSQAGKEAIIAVLEPGVFFGEGCLTSQLFRKSSATSMTKSELFSITRDSVLEKLRRERTSLSSCFLRY